MNILAKRIPQSVEFTKVGPNHVVPMQPWPQTFYVSRTMLYRDAVEVRPLTLTGLAKGIAKNFITMTWWRLLYALRQLGFLTTREACVLSLRDLTWRCWRYQRVRQFRFVRRLSRLRTKVTV